MNKNYQLGNFICSLREEFGMDQKTLAQLLGVSPSAISQCENGGGIKTEKLFQLSELFGVTIDELLAAKHLNQTLEDKWDKLYNINNYNLPELIENGKVGAVKEFYSCVKALNESFYMLLSKWIFRKTTDDEFKELCYLWQYYQVTNYINKFRKNYVVCFNEEQRRNYIKEILSEGMIGFDRQTVMWELQKIFVLNVKLCIDDVIELIENDDRIEDEETNLAFGKAMLDVLPKISQDLIYSQMIYYSDSTPAVKRFQQIMAENGVELLFLPYLKNFGLIDNHDFKHVEDAAEFDEALTNAMRIYQKKAINDFNYQNWINLDYSEYQICIDKKSTANLKALAQSQDISEYWKKYKTLRRHIESLKEVKL